MTFPTFQMVDYDDFLLIDNNAKKWEKLHVVLPHDIVYFFSVNDNHLTLLLREPIDIIDGVLQLPEQKINSSLMLDSRQVNVIQRTENTIYFNADGAQTQKSAEYNGKCNVVVRFTMNRKYDAETGSNTTITYHILQVKFL